MQICSILITSTSDRVSKEARRTADLLFYYYYDINDGESDVERNLIEDILALIRQTRGSITNFSAAGFFTIDYSTLFFLMNLLTSYVIVLIQFE